MRNIYFFIRKYFNFIFFLTLQVFSLYLIAHYSKYHNAIFSSTANEITGWVNTRYNKIEYYFRLKQTNDSLVSANERLLNKLKADYRLPDTSVSSSLEALPLDSLEGFRKYSYLSAKVVANSVSAQNNFIVLARGYGQQVREGMGIIAPNSGIVGIVTLVDKDYSLVMSLLHKDSHVSGKLLNGGETGTLSWDGRVPNIVTLSGIPKSAKVAKGDTIISSGFSTSFPRGMLIGFVDEVIAEKSTNNFLIRLRSAANFYNLEFVYAIGNKEAGEINSLLDKAKKQGQ